MAKTFAMISVKLQLRLCPFSGYVSLSFALSLALATSLGAYKYATVFCFAFGQLVTRVDATRRSTPSGIQLNFASVFVVISVLD